MGIVKAGRKQMMAGNLPYPGIPLAGKFIFEKNFMPFGHSEFSL